MRDTTIHGYFQNLVKYIQQVEQSARLGITGEAVRAQAFQQLLIKKGLITEEELTAEVGEVIRKANEVKPEEVAKTEEAPKVKLTVPSAEQVAAVEKSVVEEPKQ
jgi:hypothetical protein